MQLFFESVPNASLQKGVIFIFKSFYYFFTFLAIISIFICIFFSPIILGSNNFNSNSSNVQIMALNPNGFVWPSPGYTKINSYFGKRTAPTSGASTYHKGIDIAAPEGSYFIAVADGEITFTDFLGGGGYTITLTVR